MFDAGGAGMWMAAWLTACAPKPPVTVGSPDPPQTFTLDAHVVQPTRFGVDAAADVIVWRSGGEEVARSDVWVSGLCPPDRCVLPHVTPGEIVELRSSSGSRVDVAVLPLPPSVPLAAGVPLRLAPRSIGPADPRGALAVAHLDLDAPAEVTLDWRAVHDGDTHQGTHLPLVDVFGEGDTYAHVQTQFDDEPERRAHTYTLGAGRWFVRATLDTLDRRVECHIDDDDFPRPEWCDPPADTEPYDIELTMTRVPAAEPEPPLLATPDRRLGLGEHVVEVPAELEPAHRWVDVRPGHDVVVRWDPLDPHLAYSWEAGPRSASGWCPDVACVFPSAPFQRLKVILDHTTEPTTHSVQVWALPPPPPSATLTLDEEVEVTVRRVAPGDPRGPLADVDLVVHEPGVVLLWVDYDAGGPVPSLELLAPSEWARTHLNYFGGGPRRVLSLEVSSAAATAGAGARVRVAFGADDTDGQVRLRLEAHAE